MSGSTAARRVARLALRCYPSWWRDRYQDEQEGLLEDLEAAGEGPQRSASEWRLAASLVVGAARAHLDAAGMPSDPELWQRRARGGAALAVASISGALPLVAVLALRMGEYSPPSTGASAVQLQLSTAGRVASIAGGVLVLFGLVLLFATLSEVGRLCYELLAGSSQGRKARVVALVALPVVAVGVGWFLLHLSMSFRPVVGTFEVVRGRWVNVAYRSRGDPSLAAFLDVTGWIVVIGGPVTGISALATRAARQQVVLSRVADAVTRARALAFLQVAMVSGALVLAGAGSHQRPAGGALVYSAGIGPWGMVVFPVLAASALGTVLAVRAARRALAHAAPSP